MPNQIAIEIDVTSDVSGITQAQSALDDFSQDSTACFLQTKSALDQMNEGLREAIQNSQQLNQVQSSGSGGGMAGGWTSATSSDPSWGMAVAANSALPGRQLGLGIGGGAGAATRGINGNIAMAAGLPATTPLGTVMARFPGLFGFSGSSILSAGMGLEAFSLGSSNQVVRTLSGAAGGALLGSQIGSIIPGIGTLVGAGIGALVGGIASLFGGGGNAAKNHDSALENQGFAQMAQTLQDFYQFRTTYDSAIASIQNTWYQMAAQFQRKDSAITQKPFFDQIITALEQTQNERVARQQLQGMMAVPEFSSGGLVSTTSDGGIHAIVHPGEFVMSQQAVARIGSSVLQGLNSGSGAASAGGASGIQISLDPDSGAWLEQILASNPKALAKGIGVIVRSGGPVSRALRG